MAIQEHFTTTTAPEVLQASQAAAQQPETSALLASAPESAPSAPDVAVMAEQSRASFFGRMRSTIGRVLYEAGVDQHKATSSYL